MHFYSVKYSLRKVQGCLWTQEQIEKQAQHTSISSIRNWSQSSAVIIQLVDKWKCIIIIIAVLLVYWYFNRKTVFSSNENRIMWSFSCMLQSRYMNCVCDAQHIINENTSHHTAIFRFNIFSIYQHRFIDTATNWYVYKLIFFRIKWKMIWNVVFVWYIGL